MVVSKDHPIIRKRFYLLFRPQKPIFLSLEVPNFRLPVGGENRLSQNQAQTNTEWLAQLSLHRLGLDMGLANLVGVVRYS
jgi:hypothetical protein